MSTEGDVDVDVVVVGFGPAGAAAALAARAAGRSVVVCEASDHGGGNALYSGGFLLTLPPGDAVAQLDALCFGRTDRDVLTAYAEGLTELPDWLASIGAATEAFDPPPVRLPAPFPSWPHFPAGERVGYRVVAGGEGRRGVALWDGLAAAVDASGAEVRLGTAIERLVIDDGVVRGVVTGDGEQVTARGGVVLACGGFEGDERLAETYLPLSPVRPVGHARNVGDGLRLAMSAGASLWHMAGFFGWFSFDAPGFDAPFAVDVFGASHVYLDADGRRFCDETGFEVHDRLRALSTYLPRNANRPRLPTWIVFDEATRLAGPLNGLLGTPNDYVWSADNSAEVERGWIRSGDLEELAAQMDVDPAVLTETFDEYAAAVAQGRDDRFGRGADTLVPIDTSRLYAVPTMPGVAGTTGGPRHDGRGRVLRDDGSPIGGLFAAGAVGMVWGHLIDHGGGLTDALVFGRVAGAEAAAPAPVGS